jgi:hypothetical protein
VVALSGKSGYPSKVGTLAGVRIQQPVYSRYSVRGNIAPMRGSHTCIVVPPLRPGDSAQIRPPSARTMPLERIMASSLLQQAGINAPS